VAASIRIGTQGWSYKDWVGTFYPPGSKQEDYLPFYGQIFDTVELDTTFYHPPKPSIVRSWARHTPPSFRFAAKVPGAITHEKRLAGVGGALAEFVAGLAPLGDKRGPLLIQLPADFVREARTVADLETVLDEAPAEVRLAVEFRHVSWHGAATCQLLRRYKAALVWSEWRDLPRVAEVTTDFLYLRWMGNREEITRFDQTQVDRAASFDAWENELRRVLPEVREVYGYFNNHWAGHSPASATELKRRLGLEVVTPQQLWTQGELW
jgi:uncharacterized protein YecE (DUF72 family)